MFPCSCFSLRVHRSNDATLARTQVVASAPAPKGAGQDAHAHRGTFQSFWRRKGGWRLLTGGRATVERRREPEGWSYASCWREGPAEKVLVTKLPPSRVRRDCWKRTWALTGALCSSPWGAQVGPMASIWGSGFGGRCVHVCLRVEQTFCPFVTTCLNIIRVLL